MTTHDNTEAIVAAWLAETAPTSVPGGIHAEAVARARRSRQHARRLAGLRGIGWTATGRPMIRMAYLGVIVGVVVLASLLSLAAQVGTRSDPTPSPRPSPASLTTGFSVPFAFTVPDGSGLRRALGTETSEAIAWVVGRDLPLLNDGVAGGQGRASMNDRGVMVMALRTVWGHAPSGRVGLRTAPADFLADLDGEGVIPLEPTELTTLDGRPAYTARTVHGIASEHDLHLSGQIDRMGSPFVVLATPYQIIVADIDGVTVAVQIWARSDADLAAWMPMAMEFVDSIRFVDADRPSAAPPSR